MAQVKGTAVQSSMRYLRERFGEEVVAKILAALPDGDRVPLASVISRATRVFSSYYDTGRIAVVESRDGRAVVEVTGLEGSAPEFCERIHGWMHRTLELAGPKDLRSAHSLCAHRGDPVCRFEGSWE